MKAIEKIIEQHGLEEDELMDLFQYQAEMIGIFQVVESEIIDYDEGFWTTRTVVKYVPENKYFQYDFQQDSWNGPESFDLENVIKVNPVEVMVTQFVKDETE